MAEKTDLTEEVNNRGRVSDADDETEEIREQIEETRLQMSETIDAIEDKMTFSHVAGQVSEEVSEKAARIFRRAKSSAYHLAVDKSGEWIGDLKDKINRSDAIAKMAQNPIPLLIVSFGAGMILFNPGKKKHYKTDLTHENLSAGSPGDDAGGRSTVLGQTGRSVSGAAGTVYDNAVRAAGSIYHNAGNVAGGAVDRAGKFGGLAKKQFDHYIEEYPLAVGAASLAVGVAIGLAMPATEYETRLAGETSDKVVGQIKDSFNRQIDEAKHTVDRIKEKTGEQLGV